jgi:hypothetical protein
VIRECRDILRARLADRERAAECAGNRAASYARAHSFGLYAEIEARVAWRAALEAIALREALSGTEVVCPDCDGQGGIPVQVSETEQELWPCQLCDTEGVIDADRVRDIRRAEGQAVAERNRLRAELDQVLP